MQADHGRILVLADQAAHGFLEHGFDIRAVHLGDVTAEMVIARGSGAGAAHIAFFQHDDAFRARVSGGNGGHGPADASAHDDDIGFKRLAYRDHQFFSLFLRVDAFTCSKV